MAQKRQSKKASWHGGEFLQLVVHGLGELATRFGLSIYLAQGDGQMERSYTTQGGGDDPIPNGPWVGPGG